MKKISFKLELPKVKSRYKFKKITVPGNVEDETDPSTITTRTVTHILTGW